MAAVSRRILGDGLVQSRPVASYQSPAPPAFAGNDFQRAGQSFLGVEQPRHLAQRQAVADRDRVVGDKRQLVGVGQRPFNSQAGNRVGPVQHDDAQAVCRLAASRTFPSVLR